MLRQLLTKQHAENVSAVALSPDGKLAASSTFEEVSLWETGGRDGRRHQVDGYALAFAPDSSRLAVGSNRRGLVYEVYSGSELAALEPFGNSVEGVAFSQDGSLLALASHDGALWVVPARPMDVHRRILTRQWSTLQKFCLGNWVNAVAFHPRAERLAAGCRDGTLRVWDPWDARQLLLVDHQDHWPVSVAYSPDGLVLAAGFSNGAVGLWWNLDGSPAGWLEGHTDWVRGLAFASNDLLLTGSHDGRLRLWQWQSGAVVYESMPHAKEPVYDLAVSGELVLTAGWDRTARLFRLELG